MGRTHGVPAAWDGREGSHPAQAAGAPRPRPTALRPVVERDWLPVVPDDHMLFTMPVRPALPVIPQDAKLPGAFGAPHTVGLERITRHG